jgi:hypothetical protein
VACARASCRAGQSNSGWVTASAVWASSSTAHTCLEVAPSASIVTALATDSSGGHSTVLVQLYSCTAVQPVLPYPGASVSFLLFFFYLLVIY